MLYQTQIVMNMAAPISKSILDRRFNSLYPDIKNLLVSSIQENALPAARHSLDNMQVHNGLIQFNLTWYNRKKATEFITLWQTFNTFTLVSAEIATLEQDQV